MSMPVGSATNCAVTTMSPAVLPVWNAISLAPPPNTAAVCPAGIVKLACLVPVDHTTPESPWNSADSNTKSSVPRMSSGYALAMLSPSGTSWFPPTVPPACENVTSGNTGISTLNRTSGAWAGVTSMPSASATKRAVTAISPAVLPVWNSISLAPALKTATVWPARIVKLVCRPPVGQTTPDSLWNSADSNAKSRTPEMSTGYGLAKLKPSGTSWLPRTVPPDLENCTVGSSGRSSNNGKTALPITKVPVSPTRAEGSGSSATTSSFWGARLAGNAGIVVWVNGPVTLADSINCALWRAFRPITWTMVALAPKTIWVPDFTVAGGPAAAPFRNLTKL